MSTEALDYTAILADLEAKKAALEQTIASFRAALALGALGQATEGGVVPSVTVPSISGGEVPTGAFLGKSIPDAAKLYLEIKKQKQTSREIADALLKGGMESTSKNFPAIVHAILDRARKTPNAAIVKLGTQWGLATWWPKGIFAPNASVKGGKKKQKKARVKAKVAKRATASAEPAMAMPEPMPITEKKKGATGDRIVAILKAKPEAEYTPQQIAEQAGLASVQVAHMILANLVKSGKAKKATSGKYGAVTAPHPPMHAVV